MKKYIIHTLLFGTTILTSCSSPEEKSATTNQKPIAVTVSNTKSESGEISGSMVTSSGKLVAKNSVNVSTRIMGYITSMNVEVGQNVSAGQPLLSINATDIQAKGGQASAQIAQAQANYNSAKKDFERFQNLYNTESASQKELDDMRARYEMAKAGLQAAQQMKSEVNAQYRYTNVSAPISGTVTAKFAQQGDMASPGMPLLTIESPSTLQAEILLSEKYITSITQGMPVQVTLKSTETELIGHVSEISKSASNTGGQYLVKIKMPTSKDLLPGMFVNAQFPFKDTKGANQDFGQSVVIPKSALVENGQLTGVYTISEQKTAVLRWIKIGKTFGDQVEVLSGLNANEAYIVSANGKLFNGAKVTMR